MCSLEKSFAGALRLGGLAKVKQKSLSQTQHQDMRDTVNSVNENGMMMRSQSAIWRYF